MAAFRSFHLQHTWDVSRYCTDGRARIYLVLSLQLLIAKTSDDIFLNLEPDKDLAARRASQGEQDMFVAVVGFLLVGKVCCRLACIVETGQYISSACA